MSMRIFRSGVSEMEKEVLPAAESHEEYIISCGGIAPEPIPFHGQFPSEGEIVRKDLTAREWNRIICAVNNKQTAEEAGLKTEEALRHYRNIWHEAEEWMAKYGSWPVFGLAELEW